MKIQKREIQSGGSDKFLTFKDGESKNIILKGEFYEFYNKWVGGKGVATKPTDPEGRSRFKVNAVINENGTYVAKIWELNLTTYNKLADVNVEYPLESIVLKVTRQGTGTDTEYHVLPLLKVSVPDLSKVELNILDAKMKMEMHPKDEELPF